MNKCTNFSGMPVIKQILNYIPHNIINRTAKKYQSDKYYKKFKTYDHLVTMLHAIMSGCTSIREVVGINLACQGRINHLGLKHFPRRSTLSDANKNRSSEVFADIYYQLYHKYKQFLSDSSSYLPIVKDLHIIDSTTITLFSEILRAAGRNPINGKRKGGIKVHTMINALEDVPSLVRITSAAASDVCFLKEINLKKGSFIVFDKGYNSFDKYLEWDNKEIYFVTRQNENASYDSIMDFDIEENISPTILKDEEILIGKTNKPFVVRRITFWHEDHKKVYVFITNNFELGADKIADIYKSRWQIELLFKRLKQNFPLKYFLGENRNAIEIQVWISLIIQLILLVISRKLKRRWAYSNMASIIRYHLMSYINLIKFLNNPDASWEFLTTKTDKQLTLFDA
jgi:transposase